MSASLCLNQEFQKFIFIYPVFWSSPQGFNSSSLTRWELFWLLMKRESDELHCIMLSLSLNNPKCQLSSSLWNSLLRVQNKSTFLWSQDDQLHLFDVLPECYLIDQSMPSDDFDYSLAQVINSTLILRHCCDHLMPTGCHTEYSITEPQGLQEIAGTNERECPSVSATLLA